MCLTVTNPTYTWWPGVSATAQDRAPCLTIQVHLDALGPGHHGQGVCKPSAAPPVLRVGIGVAESGPAATVEQGKACMPVLTLPWEVMTLRMLLRGRLGCPLALSGST